MGSGQEARKEKCQFPGLDRQNLTNLKYPVVQVGGVDFQADRPDIRFVARGIDKALGGHRAEGGGEGQANNRSTESARRGLWSRSDHCGSGMRC